MKKISNIKETRIKQRVVIQLFCKNNPKIKIKNVANSWGVSPKTVSSWKNKIIFKIKKEKEEQKWLVK